MENTQKLICPECGSDETGWSFNDDDEFVAGCDNCEHTWLIRGREQYRLIQQQVREKRGN